MENQLEELIKRTELEGTPFQIISTNGKHFGVMGNYKMTEDYDYFEEAAEEVVKMTWKNLINMMIVINDFTKSQPTLKEAHELNEKLKTELN
jgi:hypothetical protein